MKKILILGGKPIGSCELTSAAKQRGLYTIVTDYLPVEKSAAKMIADEHWEISTSEIEILIKKCREENISAILTGVHEYNIEKKIELCNALSLPSYCTKKQWDWCENKALFKKQCEKYNIPVAKTYSDGDTISFPVICKPVDGSGSRGFSICHNDEELRKGIAHALEFSAIKECLIEEYLPYESCIIHYTAIGGKLFFTGMSDKHSQLLKGGASVMALQIFPSQSLDRYLSSMNNNVIEMFRSMNIQNGPIWIEAFNDTANNRFIFNEMGYRFGGSMTNYPVKYFYGLDQIELMINDALGEKSVIPNINSYIPKKTHYCILPIHLESGCISKIEGLKETQSIEGVEAVVSVHFIGDEIQNWGTAQQVFCYLHIAYDNTTELLTTIKNIKEILSVTDETGNEMLYYLFDLSLLETE